MATQRAFEAYRGDKMDHTPVTFLRAAPGQPLGADRRLRLLRGPGQGAPRAGRHPLMPLAVRALLLARRWSLAAGSVRRRAARVRPRPANGSTARACCPPGQPLRGEREGGVGVKGAAAACATCHRRSGLGQLGGADRHPAHHRPVPLPARGADRRGRGHAARAGLRAPPRRVHRRDAGARHPRGRGPAGPEAQLPHAALPARRRDHGVAHRLPQGLDRRPGARRDARHAALRHHRHPRRRPDRAQGHAGRAAAVLRRQERRLPGRQPPDAVDPRGDVPGAPQVAAARLGALRPAGELGAAARASAWPRRRCSP